MPFAVAITRAPALSLAGGYRGAPSDATTSIDAALPTLASMLGLTALDLRMRLSGEAPWVVSRVRSLDEAERSVAALRDQGFGAVSCDLAAARAWVPATDCVLSLDANGMVITPVRRRVEYAAIRAVLVATLEFERARGDVERITLPGGGRGPGRAIEITHARYEREQQRALYLLVDGGPTVRLTQGGFRSSESRGPTTRERFDAVVSSLRARAPDARYDDRFALAPRRMNSYAAVLDEGERRGAITSNAGETDVAVRLLSAALDARQLA